MPKAKLLDTRAISDDHGREDFIKATASLNPPFYNYYIVKFDQERLTKDIYALIKEFRDN